MKKIKVELTLKEWAEKRLQISISLDVPVDEKIDNLIEQCGFVLKEEAENTQMEDGVKDIMSAPFNVLDAINSLVPSPEEKTDKIPTDKVEAVKYFLNQLPDGYKERALAQVDEENIKTWETTAINIVDAVMFFNKWHKTKESNAFWLYVHGHYENPVKYPTLPPLPKD